MFEFRTFADDLICMKEKIEKICLFKKYREEKDFYIISRNNSKNNIKIRKNELKIKTFVRKEKVFELWDRRFFFPFPLRTDIIKNIIYPFLQIEPQELTGEKYREEEFLKDLVKYHKDIIIAEVDKQRFTFTIDFCDVEFVYLLINKFPFQTVAIESSHIEPALRVMKLLEFDGYENINYPEGIKRFFFKIF